MALIEEKLGEKLPAPKPDLRLVNASMHIHAPRAREMDAVTRESHIRLIGSLRRFYKPYGMDLIVNQALLGKGTLDDLSDEDLIALQRTIDRARECIADGISFEEAGLIRAQCA
ncbi:hypothetical protein ACHZ97_14755 [Lysobacter soli]|uniref:hypothetical protein n=1 Tax=Lysobacter soli TaxID=453783 RepID=UPI0037C7A201